MFVVRVKREGVGDVVDTVNGSTRLRQRDGIEAGEEFEVERIDRGEYRLVRRTPPPNEGLVKWLLECPEKGFFVPVEAESTDAL